MVESISSKPAQMVRKLHCINRWCVTGTPIKKSVEDLYGLFKFLDINPYQEKIWWREVIWKPFVNGDTEPLSSALKDIVWGTMKNQVLNQIGVPELKEVIHRLHFSPIEKVYYLKQHKLCKTDFMTKIDKFDSLDIRLFTIDRNILTKVLLPFKRLQLVCCHFQITQDSTEVQKLSKRTTAELLAHLLKTAKYDCENVHRKLIMALNGLAGIEAIREKFSCAVKTYERALQSIEDNKQNFRTDVTQQIHAAYHLSSLLSKFGNDIDSKFTALELNERVEALTKSYMEKLTTVTDDCTKNINELSNEIADTMNKFKLKRSEFPVSAWWATIFESVSEDQKKVFLEKLDENLQVSTCKSYLRRHVPGLSFVGSSFAGFLTRMFELSENFHKTRKDLQRMVKSVSFEPSESTMNIAISCHLRPVKDSPKCIYCKVEEMFQLYESKLFRFDEKKQNEKEEVSIAFQNVRRGTHDDGDLELIMKFIYNYCRRVCRDTCDLFNICIEDGANELKLFQILKKEFKVLRDVWKKGYDYLSFRDEVEMAKIGVRLLLPGESPPNPPLPYVLLPQEVQIKHFEYHSEVKQQQFDLEKKLGHLFYLQNLEKAENKDAPFEENCPICQQTFGSSWSVLQCGHCLCLFCIEQLLSGKKNFTNKLGFVCQGVPCPLCRAFTAASDVYFIENKEIEDTGENIQIKGFYSTKTNAIIKCLLQIQKESPEAKSLVFSCFNYFLFILENALKENDLKYFNFCKKDHFQEKLDEFKQSKDVNILLIPLSFGCSGLNITEATNVLLLEPSLDNSRHLQAIGRVHRIGQKETATVHRFVISETIEESIYDVMKIPSAEENHVQLSDLTLKSLKDLFENT